jgi:hypothetical protein
MVGDSELVEIALRKFQDAAELKSEWMDAQRENWRLYNNDYKAAFGNKQSWQAKGYIPHLTDLVDRQVGIVLDSYLDRRHNLVEFTTANKELAHEMLRLVMQELAVNQFDEILDDCVLMCLLSGFCVVKDEWDYENGVMKLHTVDPLDFYRVHDGYRGWLTVERMTMERGQLRMFLEDKSYNKAIIEEILAGADSGTTDSEGEPIAQMDKRHQELLGRDPEDTFLNPITIYEFWGRIYDQKGELQKGPNGEEEFTWTITGQQVIRSPIPSWYIDNGKPYSFGFLKKQKNAAYPPSILTGHAILQRGMTASINRVADKLFTAIPQWVAYRGAISPSAIAGGLLFGKVWESTLPGESLRVVESKTSTDGEFQMWAILERAMMALGVTETAMGQPTMRGRQTLGEVQERMGGGQSYLGSMVRRLERSLVRDVVRRTVVNTLQFKIDGPRTKDDGSIEINPETEKPYIVGNPNYARNVVGFLNQERIDLVAQTREEAEKLLETSFAELRVRGLSEHLSAEDKAQRMNYFLRMITQLMEMLKETSYGQEVFGMINWHGILQQSALLSGFDPEIILTKDALRAVQAAEASGAGVPEPEEAAQQLPGGRPALPAPSRGTQSGGERAFPGLALASGMGR